MPRLLLGILTVTLIGLVYISNQSSSIMGGDAGDLVSAIKTLGIPHPPGYPFYTAFGIVLNTLLTSGTSAWKTGFLSSIPAIFALFFLYDFLYFLTKKISVSLLSVSTLAFTYLFWLYSVTVEVFSLNNLFIILLLNLSIRYLGKPTKKLLYLITFIFGLSLTHHHTILFLLPILIYIYLISRIKLKSNIILKSIFLFVLGLIPYSYTFISSSTNPRINWQGDPTLSDFVNLVTRAGYGTFTSSSYISHNPILRLVDVYAFFDLYLKDFRILGIILVILSIFSLFRANKIILKVIIIGLSSFTFFLFYASFPLVDNFMLGTFERFLLPLYILTTVLIAFGINILLESIRKRKNDFLYYASVILFLIYPLSLFFLNFPKISSLKNDFTAENLGRDILNSTEGKGLLIVSSDTSLFNSQYVYYEDSKWSGLNYIHFAKLFMPYYKNQLSKYSPQVVYTFQKNNGSKIVSDLVKENYPLMPIFSKLSFKPVTQDEVWVPWGLVFRYFKKTDLPSKEEIFRQNSKLWQTFNDPKNGALKIYDHLMLSDVLRVYSIAHQEIAYWEINNGYFDAALDHLNQAVLLTPRDIDIYHLQAKAEVKKGYCLEADQSLQKADEIDNNHPTTLMLQILNQTDCYKDKDKANFYEKILNEKLKAKEENLQKL